MSFPETGSDPQLSKDGGLKRQKERLLEKETLDVSLTHQHVLTNELLWKLSGLVTKYSHLVRFPSRGGQRRGPPLDGPPAHHRAPWEPPTLRFPASSPTLTQRRPLSLSVLIIYRIINVLFSSSWFNQVNSECPTCHSNKSEPRTIIHLWWMCRGSEVWSALVCRSRWEPPAFELGASYLETGNIQTVQPTLQIPVQLPVQKKHPRWWQKRRPRRCSTCLYLDTNEKLRPLLASVEVIR